MSEIIAFSLTLPLRAIHPSRSSKFCPGRALCVVAMTTRVCRVCKQTFAVADNHRSACRFHTAVWTGAERSKFYGRAPELGVHDPDFRPRGVEYFYDCCDASTLDAPGCTFDFHRSYDDV